jgi:hypothetical protein
MIAGSCNREALLGGNMWKVTIFVCSLALVAIAAKPQNDMFMKYKAVEAYEIRPGILMMPKYSDNGQVCQVAFERLHYSQNVVTLDSAMDHEVINQIADELAPAKDRGPRAVFPDDLVDETGNSFITTSVYENVEIQVHTAKTSHENQGDIAAIIKWRHRKCD